MFSPFYNAIKYRLDRCGYGDRSFGSIPQCMSKSIGIADPDVISYKRIRNTTCDFNANLIYVNAVAG